MQEMINSFDVSAKVVQRKKNYVVYLKEGAHIVDILNVMEALALISGKHARFQGDEKRSEPESELPRTANINKTVSAAVRQLEDIVYIRDTLGFDKLPDGLRDVALYTS